MTAPAVTVAIPVLDGGRMLGETLDAVRGQRLDGELELLVADSGSTDGSRERAVRAGARVIDVARAEFSHGGTRNLLAAEARGGHVAFLTQDATPADDRWLARLMEAFGLADDVGIVFGPYRPRPGSSPMVRRELADWFGSFSPDGAPRVDQPGEQPDSRSDADRRRFFTDANGCVARRAWEQVPFRAVSYAEDQMLASDMLSAGWAKAYHPAAAVIHSHDYPPGRLLRRSFDESRALAEVHAHRAHGGPRRIGLVVQRNVRDDLAFARREGGSAGAGLAARSLGYHAARTVGSVLGSRADRLPPRLQALLSLERRAGFEAQR
jgi:glycosyltransferase involved in cell wall biosynthesis